MAEQRNDVVTLTNVRLGFPHLFKAEASVEGGDPKYSAAFIIDPTTESGKANIAKVKAAVQHVAKQRWPDKAEKILKVIEWDRKPLRDGNKNTNQEGDINRGFEDRYYVQASATLKRRPQLRDRRKNPVTEEDGVLYGGCYVDAVLSVYTVADAKKGGNGVFASIEIVRYRSAGEPFGAATLEVDDYLDDLPEDEDEDEKESSEAMDEDDALV